MVENGWFDEPDIVSIGPVHGIPIILDDDLGADLGPAVLGTQRSDRSEDEQSSFLPWRFACSSLTRPSPIASGVKT